jgi:hypothetical protein
MRVLEIKEPCHPSRSAHRITQTQGTTVLATVQMASADELRGSRLPVVHTVAVVGHPELTSACSSHWVGGLTNVFL